MKFWLLILIKLLLMHLFAFLAFLVQLVLAFEECNFDFIPMPQVCKVALNPSPLPVSPCNILYYVSKES